MSEIKTLYDAGIVADNAFTAFNLAMSALIVTTESMDDDGIQPRGKESPAVALNFAARFPMYSNSLHLIIQHLGDVLDSLRTGADDIFAACRREGKS